MKDGLYSSDIAFTGSVKAVQQRKGSRQAYAAMEAKGAWETRITTELASFIAAQTSVFLATANAQGQPYIQHRGGPAGFLRVLDEQRIGFVDYSGNRQYITQGNLAENAKAHLFLIDYESQTRIKIWGQARIVEGDADATAGLMPSGYKATAEQVIIFEVSAWSANCSRHIPRRLDATDVAAAIAQRDRHIELLEARLRSLESGAPQGIGNPSVR